MNFLEIIQRVCARVGITQPTTLAGTTDNNVLIMMDLMNEIYQGIAHGGEGDEIMHYQRKWWWLEAETRIPLFATYKGTGDAGTVSGSAGSDQLTFVTTALQTDGVLAGDRFQKIGDTQYFDVETVDSELTVTLTSDLPEAIAAGSTYRIVRPYYLLPNTLTRTRVEVLYPEQGGTIDFLPWSEYQRHIANRGQPIAEGSPCRASLYSHTSGQPRIYFDYSPDKAYDVVLPYQTDITELTADGEVPLVPSKYRRIFVYGIAARFLIDVLDDTGGAVYEKRFKALLAAMIAEQDQGSDGSLQLSPDTDAQDAQYEAIFGDEDGGIAARMAYKDNG